MFKSLRYRLQAWHTLILLLVVIGFGGTLYVEASRRRFDEIDGELLAAVRVLEGVLRTQAPAPRTRPPEGPGFRGGPPPDRPPRPRRPRPSRNAPHASAPAAVPAQRTELAAFINGSILAARRRALFRRA